MITPRRGRHGRSKARGLVLIAVVAAVVGALTSTVVILATRSGKPVSTAGVGRVGAGAPASWPSWGLTHTQFTPDAPSGFEQARADLAKQPVPQNQSIMGWGADNPEPVPGQF